MAAKTGVIITADTQQAVGEVEKFSMSMEALAGVAQGMAGALSGGALVSFVKGTIDAADSMGDLAQQVGINVAELGGWKLAADSSGASMEAVARGVKGLSGFIVKHGEDLQAAGVTATTTSSAMTQLADIFQALPDGAEKSALAVRLFGASGQALIPLLNLGSAGLAEMQEKAAEYGKKLAELAPQADKFNDSLAELALQAKIVGINMASVVTGPMSDWLEANSQAIKIAGSAAEAARLFVFNLDAMTSEKPAEEILRLTAALKDFQGASSIGKFMQSPTGFLLGGREEDLKKQIELLKFLQRQQVMSSAAGLGDYRDARDRHLAGGKLMSASDAEAARKRLMGKGASASSAASDYTPSNKPFEKQLQWESEAWAAADKATAKWREQSAAAQLAMQIIPESERQFAEAMAKVDQKTSQYAENLTRAFDQKHISPDVYKASMDKLNEAAAAYKLEAAAILAQQTLLNESWQYGADVSLQKYLDSVNNAARGTEAAFTRGFQMSEDALVSFVRTGKLNITSLVDYAADEFIRLSVVKPAMSSAASAVKDAGGFSGLLSAAGSAIKGLFGFAGGGGFTVDGTGGTDSQVVAFRATPGEDVTIRTPAQQNADGGGAIVIYQTNNIDSRTDQASIMAAMVAAKNAAVAEIYDAKRRGRA
jgi:lambda family phage tail tape measure protein